MSRRARNEGTIYQRKDGRWCAAVSDPATGRRRYFYAATQEDVQEKLDEAKSKRRAGVPMGDGKIRVGGFLSEWLEAKECGVKPRTAESYRYLIETHIAHECRDTCEAVCELRRDSLGDVALVALTPSRVERFLASKRRALSPRTVSYLLGVLRNALRSAVRDGVVGRNVAELVDPVRGAKKAAKIEPLTLEQTRTLVAAAADDALVLIAAFCGLRLGEILGLRWECVDLEAGELRVERILQRREGQWFLEEPKSETSHRSVDLPTALVSALRARRASQGEERLRAGAHWEERWGLVFTSPLGSPIHARSALTHFHRVLDRAGLPRRRLHDLRHGVASMMLAEGEDLAVIAEQLGHSDSSFTLRTYAHSDAGRRRRASARLAETLTRKAR